MSRLNSNNSRVGLNWRQINESPKQFGKSLLVGGAAFAVYLLIVAPRISEVLPKILGDELLYSQNARLLAPHEWFLPNFLFNWIFGSTNLCGYGFYSCGKTINLLLLAATGFVIYATSRLIASPAISLFLAFITVVGPIAVYASYFSPDTMFYLCMSVVIFLAVQIEGTASWSKWLALGTALAIASLVKPHALFAIPALVAFCIYLSIGAPVWRLLTAARNAGILVVSSIAIKFALGFALAGSNGLTLFGSYGDALSSATKTLSQSSPGATENSQALAAAETLKLVASSGSQGSEIPLFGGMALWELALHIGFLLIAFSVPMILAIRQIAKSFADRTPPSTATKLAFLAFSILLMGVITTAIYTAAAPSWGEVLDFRLMVRYYEYALPFLVLSTVAPASYKPKRLSLRVALSALGILVIVLAATKLSTVVPPLYTDSTLFASLYYSNISIWIFAAVSAGFIILAILRQEQATKYWVYGWLPAVTLIAAISTQISMTGPSSIKGMYTIAAQTAHELLTQEQRDQLTVVGNFKNNVQAAELWIDSKSVQGIWIERGQNFDVDSLPETTRYVLIIGEMNISGSFEVLKKESSYAIVKRS